MPSCLLSVAIQRMNQPIHIDVSVGAKYRDDHMDIAGASHERYASGMRERSDGHEMSVPAEHQPERTERRLVRDSIVRLHAYEPVEAAEELSARLGMPLDAIVKLDSNENPYGCSIRVQEALASFDRLHYYPDAQARAIRERIASYASVSAERVMVGAGSDELIDLIFLATLDAGDEVIIPTPTFGVYKARAELFGGVAVEVQRTDEFDLDLAAILDAVTPRTKLIIVTSPNNPTGNLATNQQIVQLLKTDALVIVDEAYYEFAGKTVMPLSGEFDNLIVLRTFSKWAGLAGVRIGYGVFPPAIASQVWKVKPPFNISSVAAVAVEASLDDVEYLHSTISRIKSERSRMFRQLKRLDFLTPLPSHGNFLLCRIDRGGAQDVFLRLADRGIMVRRYGGGLADYLRFTVGRPEDTDRLVAALQTIGARV